MFSLGLLWKAVRGVPGVGGTALKEKMLGARPWTQSPGCGLGETLAVPLSWRWSSALGAGTNLQRNRSLHHTWDTAPVASGFLTGASSGLCLPAQLAFGLLGESA